MLQEDTIKQLRKCIIESIGIEQYNKSILQIADILKDIEYKQIDLTMPALTDLVIEAIEDETRKYYRYINTSEKAKIADTSYCDEFSIQRQGQPWAKKRSAGKWKWKSTPEKIMLLQKIEKLREKKVSWPKIQKSLGLDARSFIYNIILAKVYATKIEIRLAHKVWENMKHGKKDGFRKMQEQRTTF